MSVLASEGARIARAIARLPWPAGVRARAAARAPDAATGTGLLARCVLTAALGAAGAATFLPARTPLALAAGAAAGWRLAEERERAAARRADGEVDRALADALDVIVACVLSGASVDRALRLLAPAEQGRLGDALRAAVRALDLGVARHDAYEMLAARAGGSEAPRLVAALSRAERYGTPVAGALAAHATEMRARARAAAEAEARTAPVKLLFPLVLCFLPAFLLLTLAPLVLSAIRSLQGV